MRFLDFDFDGLRYRARLLDDRAPQASQALWQAMPFAARAVHGQWSGELFHLLEEAPVGTVTGDRSWGFQYPGLVVLEPTTRELAICYGQGRLNSPTGALSPIPVAELGGDLRPLAEFGTNLQFEGAKPVSVRVSPDQSSPLASAPKPSGRTIEVDLDGAVATATLLEDVSPGVATSFAALLPLHGRVTNTHSSGTLIRYWNPDGGPEGETPLEVDDRDPTHVILYPGYLYYLPQRPWRGIRIPYEATAMGGATIRGTTRLVPFAKFDGDWTAFREPAASLAIHGARPITFRLIQPD